MSAPAGRDRLTFNSNVYMVKICIELYRLYIYIYIYKYIYIDYVESIL